MKLDAKTVVLVQQLIAYGFVGGLSAVLDLAIFVMLTAAALGPVAASIVSFTAATIANYFLSYFISFVRGRHSRRAEILRLVLVSLAGLLLNTLTVWALVAMGLLPLLAKVTAIGVVFGWNFIGRRMFVFERNLPPPVTTILRPDLSAVPRRADAAEV